MPLNKQQKNLYLQIDKQLNQFPFGQRLEILTALTRYYETELTTQWITQNQLYNKVTHT